MAKSRGLKPEEDGPVYFLDPEGNQISNDPNFSLKAFRAQMAEQDANLRGATNADVVRENVEASTAGTDLHGYQDMDGPALKRLAKSRNIDITGLKKKSQLIQKLEEDDARQRPFELTGRDIQGGLTPVDDEAVARREQEAEELTRSTDGSDAPATGLSNDSELDDEDDEE